MRKIEVEKRYEINEEINADSLPSPSYTTQILDIYFDTKDGDFYKKGVFIRIRNHNKLDIKFNMDDYLENEKSDRSHTHADEFSFKFPLDKESTSSLQKALEFFSLVLPSNINKKTTAEEILVSNNLTELVRVKKDRVVYKDEGFEISLDHVEDLGNFIEIEVLLEVENQEDHKELDKIKKRIDDYAAKVSSDIELSSTGYVELILKQTNFDLYKQGKYILGINNYC